MPLSSSSSRESDGIVDGRRYSTTLIQGSVKHSPAAARVNLLLKRMRDSEGVNARWVSVGNMERLRALTRAQTRVQTLIDKLVESERNFIVNIDVMQIIEAPSFKRRLTA